MTESEESQATPSHEFDAAINHFVDRVEGLSAIFPSVITMIASIHGRAEERLDASMDKWSNNDHDGMQTEPIPETARIENIAVNIENTTVSMGDTVINVEKTKIDVESTIIAIDGAQIDVGSAAIDVAGGTNRPLLDPITADSEIGKSTAAETAADWVSRWASILDPNTDGLDPDDMLHFMNRADQYNDGKVRSPVDESVEGQVLRIPLHEYNDFARKNRRLRRAMMGFLIMPGTFLVSLVSQFDVLVSNLIRCMFAAKPEMLNSSDRQMSVSDLMGFSNIEAAKEKVIVDTIEAILRKSHIEQISWFENKLGVSLREFDAWPFFVEITQRRHLLVHTDGRVSRAYIDVCRSQGVKVDSVEVGDRLPVTPSYAARAHFTLLEVGIKLGQVVWRKLCPGNIEECDRSITDIIVELIDRRHCKSALSLLDFVMGKGPKISSETYKCIFLVNRALALKFGGREGECRALVKSVEWGHLAAKFQLARAILMDENDEAFRIMRDIGARPDWAYNYRIWPLFKQIRETADFQRVYYEIFGHTYTGGPSEDEPG